jgi:hypothetical protein
MTTPDTDADHTPLGINPGITAQPIDSAGYVFAQVGWLTNTGRTYGLVLPDTGEPVRGLYICLGRSGTQATEECA